jgi:hypothetical protein
MRFSFISGYLIIQTFLFIFLAMGQISEFSLVAQESSTINSQKRITYEANPSRTGLVTYTFPKSAAKDYNDFIKLDEPKIGDLRLKFTTRTSGSFIGPDGGVVDFWKPGLYRHTRADGSIFSERESGQWELKIPNLITIISFNPKCAGCQRNLRYEWADGTENYKEWIPHRKEYSINFQHRSHVPALNWTLPNPKKFGSNFTIIGPFELYHSNLWNFFLECLRESFDINGFYNELRREYGMANEGKIPVFLFDQNKEMVAYNGQELPGGSLEGGFGGQNYILKCCGSSLAQKKGNSEIDEDARKRFFYGTFIHEAVHNIHQITCLTLTASKPEIPPNETDPWFVEGFANHVASKFDLRAQANIYEGLRKRIDDRKLPKSFDAMLKEGYSNLVPYDLGAYLVEYMHKHYGRESVKKYINLSCHNTPTGSAVKQATGISANQFYSDAILDFEETYKKSKSMMDVWSYSHLTQISPKMPKSFEQFQKNKLTLPADVREIQEYSEIPNLYELFEADVSMYSGVVVGDFWSRAGVRLYLWKEGTYKWFGSDYDATIFPNHSITLNYNGWQIFHWENGQRKMVAPDKTSVHFWNENQKAYFDAKGKEYQ